MDIVGHGFHSNGLAPIPNLGFFGFTQNASCLLEPPTYQENILIQPNPHSYDSTKVYKPSIFSKFQACLFNLLMLCFQNYEPLLF